MSKGREEVARKALPLCGPREPIPGRVLQTLELNSVLFLLRRGDPRGG